MKKTVLIKMSGVLFKPKGIWEQFEDFTQEQFGKIPDPQDYPCFQGERIPYRGAYIIGNNKKCYRLDKHEERYLNEKAKDGSHVTFETTANPRGKFLWATNVELISF